MKSATKYVAILLLMFSVSILIVNLYGLSQSLRPAEFTSDQLRFGAADITLSKEQYFESVKRLPTESDRDYAQRLAKVIADGTAHIHWERYEPSKFNQLIPIWENWILHLMGRFTGIPEYERYHFANPYRSMERGIGICGDASMVMDQLLEEHGIQAQMLSFPGHVIVSAEVDGQHIVFDPDFGVTLPFSPEQLASNISEVNQIYLSAGYTESDAEFFTTSYTSDYQTWTGPEHFITNKYYFEKAAYPLKWLIPCSGIIIALITLFFLNKSNRSK